MDNTICVEKQTKANRNLNLMFDSVSISKPCSLEPLLGIIQTKLFDNKELPFQLLTEDWLKAVSTEADVVLSLIDGQES